MSNNNVVYSSVEKEIMAPAEDYSALMQILREDRSCSESDGHTVCECTGEDDPSFPSLFFELENDVVLEMKPVWYLRLYSDTLLGGKKCRMLIQEH